jgi:hypothetical protein
MTIVVGQLVFIRGLRQMALQYSPDLGRIALESLLLNAGWTVKESVEPVFSIALPLCPL